MVAMRFNMAPAYGDTEPWQQNFSGCVGTVIKLGSMPLDDPLSLEIQGGPCVGLMSARDPTPLLFTSGLFSRGSRELSKPKAYPA